MKLAILSFKIIDKHKTTKRNKENKYLFLSQKTKIKSNNEETIPTRLYNGKLKTTGIKDKIKDIGNFLYFLEIQSKKYSL